MMVTFLTNKVQFSDYDDADDDDDDDVGDDDVGVGALSSQ